MPTIILNVRNINTSSNIKRNCRWSRGYISWCDFLKYSYKTNNKRYFLGPLLFTLYTMPFSSVIQIHNLDHHLYADDTHIYISLATPDTNRSLNQLSDCLHEIFLWMTDSKLKLNADKTEFLISGTPKQCGKLDGFFPTRILSKNITPAASAKNLGVTFDKNFNFRQHIFQTCFYHIRDLRRIRRYMPLGLDFLRILASKK